MDTGVKDLQVQSAIPGIVIATGLITTNAASSTSKGVELETLWLSPAVRGSAWGRIRWSGRDTVRNDSPSAPFTMQGTTPLSRTLREHARSLQAAHPAMAGSLPLQRRPKRRTVVMVLVQTEPSSQLHYRRRRADRIRLGSGTRRPRCRSGSAKPAAHKARRSRRHRERRAFSRVRRSGFRDRGQPRGGRRRSHQAAPPRCADSPDQLTRVRKTQFQIDSPSWPTPSQQTEQSPNGNEPKSPCRFDGSGVRSRKLVKIAR